MAETAVGPTREEARVELENLISDLPNVAKVRRARQALARVDGERDRYAVLAEARRVLRAMGREQEARVVVGFGHGRVVEALDRAEDAVFNALNVLANYLDDERAEAVLFECLGPSPAWLRP